MHGLDLPAVLVRHLVMPGQTDEAAAILEWLAAEVSPDTYVNLMAQYRPDHKVGEPGRDAKPRFPEIGRPVGGREMEAAFAASIAFG